MGAEGARRERMQRILVGLLAASLSLLELPLGPENVHTEQYTIWRGWTRGTAEGEILAPVHHRLQIDAMGWTGSTPAGGAEGDVVRVNMFDIENELKNVSRLKGKIALVTAKG